MDTMISTDNLGRHFGENKAVDGVSFKVGKGEVLGFLGPNGAGKSTTMKLLTGFLAPSFGTAKIGGHDILTEPRKVRELIGYLPENAPLYTEMTVKGFLNFVGEIRGMQGKTLGDAIERVLNMASLQGVVESRIETLSKGFRRRVGLAQALIHDPGILILDEPTDGLDPNQKHEVRELIRHMASSKCIVLSTHILEEVDEVCTRAVIIAKGKLLADSTPEELRKRSESRGVVTLSFAKEPDESVLSSFKKLPGVRSSRVSQTAGGKRSLVLVPERSANILAAVVKEAEKRSLEFSDLRLDSGQLDEVFRNITQ